ncbi:MAG: dihydrofolate reductase family protein [Roseibium sp.]
MHPIIYDVAVSLDGFISGPDQDISGFAHKGPVVDDYNSRMAGYTTAIMGRATYEFAYQFGLQAGQNPYPHMRTLVFSKTMNCPKNSDIEVVRASPEQVLKDLKQNTNGPIYLCGGGAFAGSLLELGLIDRLRFKRAPIVLGSGVRVFGTISYPHQLTRLKTTPYDNGYLLEEFGL